VGHRRRSRELALQFLYQIDMTGEEIPQTLPSFRTHFKHGEQAVSELFQRLIEGVTDHRQQIDALLGGASKRWKLSRMVRVDRTILRMAVFEILFCPDIPNRVTLNEAIELGKKYGSEDSGAFINGVLDHIISHLDNGELTQRG